MDTINTIIEYSTNLVSTGGVLVGFLLVFIECFIPILPIGVFVALNVNAFGFIPGIIISWLATSLGSIVCYLLFVFIDQKTTEKLFNKRLVVKIQKGIDTFDKITFTGLVLLITLPFTPSCLVNILCGLAGVKKRKFMASILIGKVFVITFWAYVGKSLIESITDIKSLIFIGCAFLLAYLISKIVNKKFKIE